MKELEGEDVPEVAGGQVDACGNPLPVMYPIYSAPEEQAVNRMIAPEEPLP